MWSLGLSKNDSQAIASWKTTLNRILLVFNVRPIIVVLSALTVRSQTELGLNIYVTISDVRDGVTETRTVVADTHAMVSEIRREMLGSQNRTDNKRRSVSDTWTTSIIECTLTAVQTTTRSETLTTVRSNVLYSLPVQPANRLPRHQGPVSDAMN